MSKKTILVTIIFLILAFVFLAIIWVWRGIYLPKQPGSIVVLDFGVERGQGAKEIALNLEKQGIIRNSFLFRVYVLSRGAAKNIQAGKYEFSLAMNVPEIVRKMVAGEVAKNKITILEGWNLKDINDYFEKEGISKNEEFFGWAGRPGLGYLLPLGEKDFSGYFDFLKDKPKSLSLEGYLFPDTYEILEDLPLKEVIKKILSNFDQKLTTELKEEISRQQKSIFQIITMASLIEKEVRGKNDKGIVSGVLWKRLEAGMPLQVDATVLYITGKSPVLIEDTKIDSPYNTYKYKGLPSGPISNPGLESIEAAIYPEESPYWYYLSAPDGKTIFSKTLQEHNIAKVKYLY